MGCLSSPCCSAARSQLRGWPRRRARAPRAPPPALLGRKHQNKNNELFARWRRTRVGLAKAVCFLVGYHGDWGATSRAGEKRRSSTFTGATL